MGYLPTGGACEAVRNKTFKKGFLCTYEEAFVAISPQRLLIPRWLIGIIYIEKQTT